LLAVSNVVANENWFASDISCRVRCWDDIKLWINGKSLKEYPEFLKCSV
jgi:hypothetical protein